MDRFLFSNRPKLVISEELVKKIAILHNHINGTEWSGELITREEGCITDLDKWTIYAEDLYLVDIGDATYTEYEVGKDAFAGPDIIELFELFPGLEEGTHKRQHIHTHHTMQAFFSGEDWKNLENRAENSNYALMLIVNVSGEWVAKVAFKGTREAEKQSIVRLSNNMDGYSHLTTVGFEEHTYLFVMDCEVVIPTVTPVAVDPFIERINKVRQATSSSSRWKGSNFSGFDTFKAPGNHIGGPSPSPSRQKSIWEMTEGEWNRHEQQNALVIEERHARAFLNYYMSDGSTINSPIDFSDPTKLLTRESHELGKHKRPAEAMEAFLENFSEEMQYWFDEKLVPVGEVSDLSDYVRFCEAVKSVLKPIIYCPLVALMLKDVEDEIDINDAYASYDGNSAK